jgi:Domain of unknown function (DUF397)
MTKTDAPTPPWRKSTFSEAGNCVEVADREGIILVRDNKLFTESSVLSFSAPIWRQFIHTINKG